MSLNSGKNEINQENWSVVNEQRVGRFRSKRERDGLGREDEITWVRRETECELLEAGLI